MEVRAVPNAIMDLRSGEADLVSVLMAARRGAATVAGRVDPLSLDRAYAVQAQVFAATGDRLTGYKLAATSAGSQAAFGVDAHW